MRKLINHNKGEFVDTYSRESLSSLQGLICVDRMANERLQTLPVIPQNHYKEWSGCFSLLGSK